VRAGILATDGQGGGFLPEALPDSMLLDARCFHTRGAFWSGEASLAALFFSIQPSGGDSPRRRP
jgi:hypothetical protein